MKLKKQKLTARKLLIYFFLFLAGSLFVLLYKSVIKLNTQININRLVEAAGYPEIKGREPTFHIVIKTKRSITHVFSYLPTSVLDRGDFDEKAAEKVINFVEDIAQEHKVLLVGPYANQKEKKKVTLVPRVARGEHFVFFVSDKEPYAKVFHVAKYNNEIYSNPYNKTFFRTISGSAGSTTLAYITEWNTWKKGLPLIGDRFLTPHQQMNVGFNVEIWKRSSVAVLMPSSVSNKGSGNFSFDASETLWNTFGRVVVIKQERGDISVLEERLNGGILSKTYNVAFYPFDNITQTIYKNSSEEPLSLIHI